MVLACLLTKRMIQIYSDFTSYTVPGPEPVSIFNYFLFFSGYILMTD